MKRFRIPAVAALVVFVLVPPASVMAEGARLVESSPLPTPTVLPSPSAALELCTEGLDTASPQFGQQTEHCVGMIVAVVLACAGSAGLGCAVMIYMIVASCSCINAVGFIAWAFLYYIYLVCEAACLGSACADDCEPPSWSLALDDECTEDGSGS